MAITATYSFVPVETLELTGSPRITILSSTSLANGGLAFGSLDTVNRVDNLAAAAESNRRFVCAGVGHKPHHVDRPFEPLRASFCRGKFFVS